MSLLVIKPNALSTTILKTLIKNNDFFKLRLLENELYNGIERR